MTGSRLPKTSSAAQSKSFVIDIELYDYKVHVLYLFTDDEIKEYVKKTFRDSDFERSTAPATFCNAEEAGLPFNECIIDFKRKLNQNGRLTRTWIAHEVFHAVCEITRYVDIPLCQQSEEAYAYLAGLITEKIYAGLFGG